jgi:hypothetical protein
MRYRVLRDRGDPTDRYANPYGNIDAHRHPVAHTQPNSLAETDPEGHPDQDFQSDTYADSDDHADGHSDAHGHLVTDRYHDDYLDPNQHRNVGAIGLVRRRVRIR